MIDYLQLIAKKLSNEINDFEERELTEWINESKENELFFRRFEEFWSKGKYSPKVKNQEEVFKRISEKIGLKYPKDELLYKKKSVPINYWRHIAASIIIVFISGIVWWHFNQEESDQVAVVEEAIIITKSNPSGRKSQVTLPDGTKVKLNSESYIEYSTQFNTERLVKLVGEAFFEVQRDTLHPFIVSSGDIQVKVLGTSFNVHAFPFEESMSVAVASGKVFVEKKNKLTNEQTSTLLPSEMVSIDHKTGIFQKSHFDPDVLAWRDGILAFEKATFNEIMGRLERWYGVDIVVKRTTPISDGFTGRYENATLETVLKGMSFSSDFSFQVYGDTVFIN